MRHLSFYFQSRWELIGKERFVEVQLRKLGKISSRARPPPLTKKLMKCPSYFIYVILVVRIYIMCFLTVFVSLSKMLLVPS